MIIPNLPIYTGFLPQGKVTPLKSAVRNFDLEYDFELSLVRQRPSHDLDELLRIIYEDGSTIGTPLSHSGLGAPYARDFFTFVAEYGKVSAGKLLEVGCGNGYLLSLFQDAGWHATGVEPGEFSVEHAAYGVSVVRDFFPSSQIEGKFDAVVAYGVLEHMPQPLEFLADVKGHLVPDGQFFLSVPNCELEITTGDPSCLAHEHFSYFDRVSLGKVLGSAGFEFIIQESKFARTLFAVASPRADNGDSSPSGPSLANADSLHIYPQRAMSAIERAKKALTTLATLGSVGIWSPARSLNYLPLGPVFRFFDDDPLILGATLPPFPSPIEGPDDFASNPPDVVLIASSTFSGLIEARVRDLGFRGPLLLASDLLVSSVKLEEVVRRRSSKHG